MYTISGKALSVLKIFLQRHTPKAIFLEAQNCFGLVLKVPLPLQISGHSLETQFSHVHLRRHTVSGPKRINSLEMPDTAMNWHVSDSMKSMKTSVLR